MGQFQLGLRVRLLVVVIHVIIFFRKSIFGTKQLIFMFSELKTKPIKLKRDVLPIRTVDCGD